MRKSGEKVEGTSDTARQPQTVGAHESSRRQDLRVSASLIHRCRSFVGSVSVGSVNRSRRFRIQASAYRPGSPSAQPGHVRRSMTRRVAKFYISCCDAAPERCSQRSAKRRRSLADANVANAAGLPGRCGARPDQRRRLMTGPERSFASVEPAPETKRSVFRSAQKKSPLLTSGEPRRRSFFGLLRKLMRAWWRRWAGIKELREPLKIILVAASRRHRHLPNVALASRRSTSLWGRCFVCPHQASAAASPAWKP
jgi:hypothetical protein